jgi:hypothetical protein
MNLRRLLTSTLLLSPLLVSTGMSAPLQHGQPACPCGMTVVPTQNPFGCAIDRYWVISTSNGDCLPLNCATPRKKCQYSAEMFVTGTACSVTFTGDVGLNTGAIDCGTDVTLTVYANGAPLDVMQFDCASCGH